MTVQSPERDCGPCFRIRGVSSTRIILWLAAIAIVSFASGFAILALAGGFPPSADHPFTPFRHTGVSVPLTKAIPLEGASYGDIRLTLGAGNLSLAGGASDGTLMEETIFSASPEWQPEIVQSVNNSRKTLVLTEKGHKGKEWFAVDSPNGWDVRITDRIPVRLDVNVGAGETNLDLSDLNLESLTVHNGAGDTVVDLAGYHGGRFDAAIKNGVGDLTLRIPKESNTRIRVDHGLSDILADGFVQKDGMYLTEGFNTSSAVNEITLNQGIGSISLETA